MAKQAKVPEVVPQLTAVQAKFIEQGSDPVIAKKALEDASNLSRNLWVSFLIFGTYLVITFAGVTHRDLFLQTPITLPVLNAKLPLVTFFWVAPLLFVIFHLYLLLSLKLLADQVHHYLGLMADADIDADVQDRARLQLPNFVVVQVLGGTSGQINSWSGKLLTFTAILTLVAGPIILLLFAQLMFLPYHGWYVTMAQRVLVVIDLVFIWYFWRAIKRLEPGSWHVWSGVASSAVLVSAFFVFMYPGEKFYGLMPRAVFVETGYNVERANLNVLYNTLVLPSDPLVGDEQFEKLEDRNQKRRLQPSQGQRSVAKILTYRDFNQAVFNSIDLRKADLSYSHFESAYLQYASLQGASLDGAFLQGASLDGAFLQGASLDSAFLQGASLRLASLQGAVLEFANLQGAFLANAKLQGASLVYAKLQGASLRGASLQGASLDGAFLQGASLRLASMQGASFGNFLIEGASLEGASLADADVWRSQGQPTIGPTDLKALGFFQIFYGDKLEHKTFDEVLAEWLRGVPVSGDRALKQTLKILDRKSPDPENMTDWKKAKDAMAAVADFKARMLKSLEVTACSEEAAPYVAQGIVAYRLSEEDYGQAALPLINRLIAGCPGTKGMDQATIDQLHELRKKLTTWGGR